MPLRITNNIASLNAQRNLNKSQSGLSKSLERLSSGLRINRAGDDAAGLAISEKLRSNIRALNQASRNASDGIGLIQTAEGAMQELSTMLQRMKELAEQAATGTVGTSERGFLNSEFTALRSEIDRIAASTKFNETYLLNGSLDVQLQIGTSSASTDSIQLTLSNVGPDALGLITNISTTTNALAALSDTTDAISTLSSRRAAMGAVQNRLESIISNINTVVENLTGAESRIRDVDVAAETAELTKNQILLQAGVSVLSQANQMPTIALNLLSGT